jgi:fibulin 1/2
MEGSFSYECMDGFEHRAYGLIGCQDIDECYLGIDNCPQNSLCTNTDGSYRCDCNRGYVLNNAKNSCVPSQDIFTPTTWTTTESPFIWTDQEHIEMDDCFYGTRFNPKSGICEDIDECKESIHLCLDDEICQNYDGFYTCT